MASQAERDHFYYLSRHTRDRVQRSCAGEMEREVHAVLGPFGVNENISRQLADDLLLLEHQQAAEIGEYARTCQEITSRKKSWWRVGSSKHDTESGSKWNEEVGLTAFLIKLGEGMGEF